MTAAGWSKHELDAEFGPIEQTERVVVPSVLTRWFEVFRDDVLSGRVDLHELLELTDADMQAESVELCPVCSRYPVRDQSRRARQLGVCGICYLYSLKRVHDERTLELTALRDNRMARKDLQRLRDELEPDRQRQHPPYRVCAACGERLPALARHPEAYCVACLELHERRHPDESEDR